MSQFFITNAPLIAILALIVLTIVALGIASEMFKRWLEHKEVMAQALNVQMAEKTAEKAAQYAAHTERLEQRMRVLERIATDKGADLSDEIERLRDERAVN